MKVKVLIMKVKRRKKDSKTGSQMGHKEQDELTELIKKVKGRTRSRRKLNKNLKRWIFLPNRGCRRETSLRDLLLLFKNSQLGRHLLAGGSHSVPVVDFVKEQHKMLSIITEQRLRMELMREFDHLTGIGFSNEAATF